MICLVSLDELLEEVLLVVVLVVDEQLMLTCEIYLIHFSVDDFEEVELKEQHLKVKI